MWAIFYAAQPSGVEYVVLTTAYIGSRYTAGTRDEPESDVPIAHYARDHAYKNPFGSAALLR
jgi:hypothetical protein